MGATYHLINLGCKVNRVEADGCEALFASCGIEPASIGAADIVLINTCTVTGEAEKKTRKAVHKTLREASAETIVVTGCSTELKPEEYAALDPRICVVPKAGLYAWIQTYAKRHAQSADIPDAIPVNEPTLTPDAPRQASSPRSRLGIKVQDGCDNACTYCIVHVARGASHSLPSDQILAVARDYFNRGVAEIILTGINLGAYSHAGLSLADLVERLLELVPQAQGRISSRIRLSSIEPMDIDNRLIELLAHSDGSLCRHLHLPLQAGSTKVLSEMNRPYTAQEYLDLVNRLRTAVPGLSLSTDIIVGFPGETESEFAETLAMARACAFSKIHVFPYSIRENTPAAQRADHIDPAVKAHRAEALRNLSLELRSQDLRRRKGQTEYAVVEGNGKALTESYYLADYLKSDDIGRLVRVTL